MSVAPSAVLPAGVAPPAFSERTLRDALGQFATGVTVVTAWDAASGQPVGLTVSSFNSVSLQPPLVLWSLGLRASTLAAFEGCSHYAIHVLAQDQLPLANRFATRGIDRFADLPWSAGLGRAPLLAGALATFECRNRNRHPEGDHVIFVGEVLRCQSRADAQPLLYHRGQMRGWDA